jgi:hypothetical protein
METQCTAQFCMSVALVFESAFSNGPKILKTVNSVWKKFHLYLLNSSVLDVETKAELSIYLIGACFQLFTTYNKGKCY